MKKLIPILLVLSLLTIPCAAYADDSISILIDGQPLECDVQPTIINDRTMVPMRAIFEALGASVSWDDEQKVATGELMGITVKFPLNTQMMGKNTVSIPIDAPATIIENRTMLPVRAVAESFGMSVQWNSDTKTVEINTKTNKLASVPMSNGNLYLGEVDNGFINGYGTIYDSNNNIIFMGRINYGMLEEGGKVYDDSVFYGTFSNNEPYNGSLVRFSDNSTISFVNGYAVDVPNTGTSSPTISVPSNTYDNSTYSSYENEINALNMEYQKKLDEIAEYKAELNELLNTDPMSTSEAEKIIESYKSKAIAKAQKEAQDAAARAKDTSGAYGGASVAAATDSLYNSMQKAAMEAVEEARPEIMESYNRQVYSLQMKIELLTDDAERWYNVEYDTICSKYNIR